MPVIAAASIWYLPFLTVTLWLYIPDFVRYAAPSAGLMVLVYALRPGRALLGLMLTLAVLTVANPIVGILPMTHGQVSIG